MEASEKSTAAIVEQYFCHFNQKAFDQVALLFDEQGQLTPPFDSPLTGPAEIADYLQRKAQKMTAFPRQQQAFSKEGHWQIDVVGQVLAIAFKVNVSWQFVVTADGKILQVQIKLLASPGELLELRAIA